MLRKVESWVASFIGTIVFFSFVGWMLDQYFETGKNLLAIFIVIGFINAAAYIGYQIYKDVSK